MELSREISAAKILKKIIKILNNNNINYWIDLIVLVATN